MLKTTENVFVISTKSLSYVFHADKTGLLFHDYFGKKVDLVDFDVKSLSVKPSVQKGTSTMYDESQNKELSMDVVPLEFSFPHKGDYKSTPILLKNEKFGYVFDFKFDRFEQREPKALEGLPTPHSANEELVIILKDEKANVEVELHYLVFEECDVICRNVTIVNNGELELSVLKALSYQLDLVNREFELTTLTGGWASEMNQQKQTLIVEGKYSVESRTGNSSCRANPFFMLKEKSASLDHGDVYLFNLIYSGNHLEEIELSHYGLVRVEAGINPFCFEFKLKQGERFETPYAVLTYSDKGINGARLNMHHFTNNHVIPSQWNNTIRPVVINNWEGTYFKFTESKLLALANDAKKYGAELFVLDDGWFGARNSDTAGLGDYNVNKKKLPSGLSGLSKKIHKKGMKFGLWFEPEAVNPDSDCYRAHPEWAIKCVDREPSLGRHELILNLSLKDVQDYLINSVSGILNSAKIEFVKWDMNRNISDITFNDYEPGEFYHRYMLGLYRVLSELTKRFPDVLFEGCASGGNRFDLGILSYFPQIWASDDTDAHERITIQSGYYLGYPQSTVSAHVSSSPSHQLLRRTPIETRFNVAMFGVLGFELLFNELDKLEKKKCKQLIEVYKANREVLQFGDFYELDSYSNNFHKWQVLSKDKKSSLIGHFNVLQLTHAPETILNANGLIDEQKYKIDVVSLEHNIKEFGGLVNMLTPVHLNPNGWVVNLLSKKMTIPYEKESYVAYGNAINNKGIILNPEWSASGLNEGVRVLEDFGSRLYLVKADETN
ncbi:MAG: alpha-galactosidase [Bacilli bacterium]|nr:alpha-galactosidase [Bacilli bacterium]